MSPLIYEPKSTTHTGKSTVNYYIFTSNQTTRHISSSKFLPWSVKEYLILHVIKSALINKAAPDYSNARKKNGFNKNIKFTPRPRKRRKHSRNILWFNLSFSSNVKTNIGKIFLRLLDKHFPKHHKYYKLFSWNNIKNYYGTCEKISKSVSTIITAYFRNKS